MSNGICMCLMISLCAYCCLCA